MLRCPKHMQRCWILSCNIFCTTACVDLQSDKLFKSWMDSLILDMLYCISCWCEAKSRAPPTPPPPLPLQPLHLFERSPNFQCERLLTTWLCVLQSVQCLNTSTLIASCSCSADTLLPLHRRGVNNSSNFFYMEKKSGLKTFFSTTKHCLGSGLSSELHRLVSYVLHCTKRMGSDHWLQISLLLYHFFFVSPRFHCLFHFLGNMCWFLFDCYFHRIKCQQLTVIAFMSYWQ